MQASKEAEQELETQALNLLEKENMPLSIGFVAYHLKVTWQTARSLLLKMSLRGKIEALETSKGFMFCPKQEVA
jgi:hypothetical protein